MAAALALLKMGTTGRFIFLYNTCLGVTLLSEKDVSTYGDNASV